jgi:KaiC/GvpD/RAD55 family RecA-like ATPase
MSDRSEIQSQEEVQRHYTRHPRVPRQGFEPPVNSNAQENDEARNQKPEILSASEKERELENCLQSTPLLISGFEISEQSTQKDQGLDSDSPLNLVMTSSQLSEMGTHLEPMLVDGLVPAECFIVWGGEAKSGKTYHAMIGLLEITRKGKLYGRYQAREGKCIYFNQEINSRAFGKRFNEVCAGMGMDPINNPNFVSVSDLKLNLLDEASIKDIETIIEAHNPAMIVIDTLAASAHFREHDDMKVKQIFLRLKALSHKYRIAVILLAHHGKKNKALTGHASMLAIPDAIFALHRLKNGRAIFEVVNHRHEVNEGKSIEAQLVKEKGKTWLEVVPDPEKPKADQVILDALADGQWRRRAGIEVVCRVAKVMPKDMDLALKALLEKGNIERMDDPEQKGSGNRRHVYRLRTTNQQAG